MNIKLIPAGGGSRFTFPALPEKIQGKYGARYQSFDILSKGAVKVPKGTDAAEFSWDGVFFGRAKRREPIVKKNQWKEPEECVKILNRYLKNGTVLNLIVTETWINADVTISSFQPRPVGAYGNIEYSITFVQKKTLRIYTTDELQIAAFVKKTAEREDGGEGTASGGSYTVKSGSIRSGGLQPKNLAPAQSGRPFMTQTPTRLRQRRRNMASRGLTAGTGFIPGPH